VTETHGKSVLRRPWLKRAQFKRSPQASLVNDMAGTGALQPAPFVNAEYMARHMNSVVRVVGTLVDASPGNVKLKTSDAQIVSVRFKRNGRSRAKPS
jgi:hypothetical protein